VNSTAPRLVTVAHGTRLSSGNLVASAITARAARRLGRVRSQTSYVELCEPAFHDVMGDNRAASVVVPLLLSTGFHIKHDIPGAVATSPGTALLARPLGPHPLLAEVMCLRLRGAGAHPGDPVVMVAAGSNDPDTVYDLAAAGRMLQARWGSPVRVATVSGIGRPIHEVVEEARADGRVAVAPYLLSPGYFSRRARALSELAGVATVADVLGAHPLVAELVVRRYRAVLAASRAAA
jgi:sirohydrochlorin ferrochelatase